VVSNRHGKPREGGGERRGEEGKGGEKEEREAETILSSLFTDLSITCTLEITPFLGSRRCVLQSFTDIKYPSDTSRAQRAKGGVGQERGGGKGRRKKRKGEGEKGGEAVL